ncbi:hypothetical protein KTI63_07010 [Acinetobacter guillouiae]|uniref:hypothetical protein n=1 Tax=Acinetobacter guillouiae TaxID=106649 RepID=UPI0021D06453|nr:hypothetical protein [Acinetobacter guillouiae]MCU4492223.1 hypothetical protein [Acinetobacter guillouiae]
MKLVDIEYLQRIKELKCLIEFYKIQMKPFKLKAGPQHDEHTRLVAYLDILFQLEKVLLSFDYNGKLEQSEERDFFNLIENIDKLGLSLLNLYADWAENQKSSGNPKTTLIQLIAMPLHSPINVWLRRDHSFVIYQLGQTFLHSWHAASQWKEESSEKFEKRRKSTLISKSLTILENYKSDRWDEWDKRTEDLKLIFDQMMRSKDSVKVVCINLPIPIIPNQQYGVDTQQQFSVFREKIKELAHYLGMFYKLEYSGDGQLFYFCVVVFENLRSVSITEFSQRIAQTWWDSQHVRGLSKPEQVLNQKLYRSKTLQAGVITKKSENYRLFVRTTLAYVANMQSYFPIYLGQYPLIEAQSGGYAQNKKVAEARIIIPRKRVALEHQQKESDILKDFKLDKVLKPLKKDILDIELCYTFAPHIEQCNDAEFKVLIQDLIRIEVAVVLASVWKQEAIVRKDNELIEHDWGRLLQSYELELGKINDFLKYVDHLGPRVLCFIIAFFMIQAQKYTSPVFDFSLYKNELQNNIKELLNLSLHDFLKKVKELELRGTINLKVHAKLDILLTSQRSRTESLQEWLSMQKRVKKSSFRAVQNYYKKLEKKGIHRDVQFTFLVPEHQTLQEIDKFLKKIIDLFKKSHGELLGYIGRWSYERNSENECKYTAIITFFFDEHYIEFQSEESWFKELGCLIKTQNANSKTSSLLKMPVLKVVQIPTRDDILDFQGMYGQRLNQPEKKLQNHRYSLGHLFALIHRDLYWMHTAILQKQILIRGRNGYKKRTRKKEKKQA